jgi:hypothetical protein
MKQKYPAPFLGGSIFSCPLGRFQTYTVANPYLDNPCTHGPLRSAAAYSENATGFSLQLMEGWFEFCNYAEPPCSRSDFGPDP